MRSLEAPRLLQFVYQTFVDSYRDRAPISSQLPSPVAIHLDHTLARWSHSTYARYAVLSPPDEGW
jgi:hypothetical protein